MTKNLFLKAKPNTNDTIMAVMERGYQIMQKDATIKDFIVEIDWKKDQVSLYVCREETK